jgi:uncharacterized iron-regulated membrane protein
MKVIIGIAGLLLVGAVIWTIVSIWRHPKTDPIVNNPTPTATVEPAPTTVPTSTPSNSSNNSHATANNQSSNQGSSTAARRTSGQAGEATSYTSSGDITTTITTETIDEWGNRHVETRTETARW